MRIVACDPIRRLRSPRTGQCQKASYDKTQESKTRGGRIRPSSNISHPAMRCTRCLPNSFERIGAQLFFTGLVADEARFFTGNIHRHRSTLLRHRVLTEHIDMRQRLTLKPDSLRTGGWPISGRAFSLTGRRHTVRLGARTSWCC
jgi:hypothetical protein